MVLEQIRQSVSQPTTSYEEKSAAAAADVAVDDEKSAHRALLLVGGLNLAEAERGDTSKPNVVCYLPDRRVWTTRKSWPERGLRGFSVSKFNSDVIVTGELGRGDFFLKDFFIVFEIAP